MKIKTSEPRNHGEVNPWTRESLQRRQSGLESGRSWIRSKQFQFRPKNCSIFKNNFRFSRQNNYSDEFFIVVNSKNVVSPPDFFLLKQHSGSILLFLKKYHFPFSNKLPVQNRL